MRELTGAHVLAITVSAFAVIIGVNFTMAYKAVSTFPGLEVENSYVASQDFDRDRAAQVALGWSLAQGYDLARQELTLRFTDAAGKPVNLGRLHVLVGRTTEARDDQLPAFELRDGAYLAKVDLPRGKWMMQIEAHAQDGTLFRQRRDLVVKG
jgi:nitrogen fixation protein FixH